MKYYTQKDIDEMINDNKIILLVNNIIYDFTNFDHPFNICFYDNRLGKDVSIDYNFHSKESQQIWKKYKIGKLNVNKNCTIM